MKKTILITGGVIVLALLLAGAAFIGGRLLKGQGLTGGPRNVRPILGGGNGPGFQQSRGSSNEAEIQPAKELPQTPADVAGVFDHRQGNSIFIGTGQVTVTQQRGGGGGPETSHDGPVVEVVVTSQTKIYKDVTAKQFNGPPPEGQKVQQVLELGSLEEIGQGSMITVWGRKTGDRFIADVLVYGLPTFITSP
jgi:hypothetical protein